MVPSPCLRMLLNRLDKDVVRTEDGGIWALCRGCKLLSSNPASGETPKPPSSFSGQSCRALDPQSTATVRQSWGVIRRGNSRSHPAQTGSSPAAPFSLSQMGQHRRSVSLLGSSACSLGSCRQIPATGCLNLHVPAAPGPSYTEQLPGRHQGLMPWWGHSGHM